MRSRQWLLFILLSLAWGASFLFIKLALNDLSPLMIGFVRLVIASVTMWIIAVATHRRPRFGRRTWLTLAAMGLFNNSLAFVLIPWGEQYISSSLAAILNSTVPLFTIVLAHFVVSDERLNNRRVGGLVIGFSGVVVLMAPKGAASVSDLGNLDSLLGSLAVVVASICYAIATVIGRRNLRGEQPVLTSATQLTFGALWLLPVALLSGDLLTLPDVSTFTWLSMLWLGAVGSGLAYLIYFTLLREVGATQVVVVTYVLPFIGVALGVLLLNEPLTWSMIAGLGLILAGLIAINGMPGRHAKPQPSAAS